MVGFLLKTMGRNILAGKSILSISLPIEIFETRSNLERYAESFIYAPTYLDEVAGCSDPVVQMS